MENTTVNLALLCLIFMFFSCKEEVKNEKYIACQKKTIFFKHKTFQSKTKQEGSFIKADSIYFSKVFFQNKNIDLKNILDVESFDKIISPKNAKEINNPFYYKDSTDFYYFKDRKYLYSYYDDITNSYPSFSIIGNSNEYRLLGGAYLLANNKIYCKGKEIEADPKTFKTAKMRLKHSEWFITIGVDKNNIYQENQKKDKMFLIYNYDEISKINKDSLIKEWKL